MEHARREMVPEGHDDFVAEVFDRARDVRGWTVAELARRSLIDEGRLGRLLRRERKIRAGEAVRLCCALEIGLPSPLPPDLKRDLDRLGRRL